MRQSLKGEEDENDFEVVKAKRVQSAVKLDGAVQPVATPRILVGLVFV